MSYALLYLWANPADTLQGDPGAFLTDMGGQMWYHLHGPPGGGGQMWNHHLGPPGGWSKNFKEAIVEIGIILLSMSL